MKYFAVVRMSWQKELEYRFNFFLGRLRGIVLLLLLYYIWLKLVAGSDRFAGYTLPEITTYLVSANILRAVIFGSQNNQIAFEINEGWFSKYLVMPVNHFYYEFSRQLAQRFINLLSAIFEVSILVYLFNAELFWQQDYRYVGLSFLSVILAIALYYVLTYAMGLIAFWSREASGPRFLFDILVEFTSGLYYPLNILAQGIFLFFQTLPFMYLFYVPVSLYLGRVDLSYGMHLLMAQFFWILIAALATYFLWKKGLKHYSGEGS